MTFVRPKSGELNFPARVELQSQHIPFSLQNGQIGRVLKIGTVEPQTEK